MESEQGLAVRILFAGACRGYFNKLFKRVEKVHNKNGPFDALFCVGDFFSEPEGSETDVRGNEEFMEFLSSGQKMPMKTYVLGAYGARSQEVAQRMEEVDCNIHCLGKSGILEMPNGLTVAFVGGVYHEDYFEKDPSCDPFYTRHDVLSLKETAQSRGGEVDFLLSCEWPENITNNLPDGFIEDPAALPRGSPHISSLLTTIRPRYHFTSQPPLFFSRVPYKNPDLGAGSHVTRFTSLCPFGSTTKQNLFALCLTPAQFMTTEKLCEIPSDATDSPFDTLEERKRPLDAQVWGEGFVDDSSCTPQPYGVAPQQPFDQGSWNMGSPLDRQEGDQQMMGQHPQLATQSGQLNNGCMGAGVQALLHNIGRGGVLSPGVSPTEPQAMAAQNHNGVGFGNAQNLHQSVAAMNNASAFIPNMGGMSAVRSAPQSPMPVNAPHQPYPGQVNSPTVPPGNLQHVWASLSQNPQLLNAAMSMGLLPQLNVQSPVAQSSPNQVLLANALATLASSQQQGIQMPFKMEVDAVNTSQGMGSPAFTPAPTITGRNQHSTPQSKRYKRNALDANAHIPKDKRKTCYVGRLPYNATREDVADFFSQAGQVIHVVKRVGEAADSTWAFVQFATRAERDHAIQTLNQARFGDGELTVKPAKDELEFDPSEPVNDCWFCLGSPSSDKALIVSIGNESYLALDKGPIRDDHVLVIPTNHYPNTLRMPESCYEEMQLYLRGLGDLFASQGRRLLAFERYLQIPRLRGNHTHISVISIDAEIAQQASQVFIDRGRMQKGDWTVLNAHEGNRDAVHDIVGDEEYILVYLPDGSKLVRTMFKKTRLPVSFCRDVVAELVGIPERADWKVCLSSEAEEKVKVERFKAEFSAFDYPNKTPQD